MNFVNLFAHFALSSAVAKFVVVKSFAVNWAGLPLNLIGLPSMSCMCYFLSATKKPLMIRGLG
jgi:hypothetical protein